MTNNLSAGTRVRALDYPRAQQVFIVANITNVSQTTYQTGSPEVAVYFTAPSTGRVAVTVGAGTGNNGANADRLFVTYQIFEGDPNDGITHQAAEAKRGLSNPATGADTAQYHGHTTMVDGLTPGTKYYARVVHRTTISSSTADISHRHITVWPIP